VRHAVLGAAPATTQPQPSSSTGSGVTLTSSKAADSERGSAAHGPSLISDALTLIDVPLPPSARAVTRTASPTASGPISHVSPAHGRAVGLEGLERPAVDRDGQ
jgi:hypothetical protein